MPLCNTRCRCISGLWSRLIGINFCIALCMFCVPQLGNWSETHFHNWFVFTYSAHPVCTEILLGEEQGVQGRTVSVRADITFCYGGSYTDTPWPLKCILITGASPHFRANDNKLGLGQLSWLERYHNSGMSFMRGSTFVGSSPWQPEFGQPHRQTDSSQSITLEREIIHVTEWLFGPHAACVDSICDCVYVWLICG